MLGTPPAFVLSQDQTLRLIPVSLQLHPLLQNEPVARSSCTSVLYTFSTSASAPLASALRAPLSAASASVSLLCIPLSWCPPLSFRPAPRFPSRPPSSGATRESILRLKRFVNYFFQLFSSNAGERVRVNLPFFTVHNEGGARQNFLKLHMRETTFHDLCGAPTLYEKSVRSWRVG